MEGKGKEGIEETGNPLMAILLPHQMCVRLGTKKEYCRTRCCLSPPSQQLNSVDQLSINGADILCYQNNAILYSLFLISAFSKNMSKYDKTIKTQNVNWDPFLDSTNIPD